LKAEAALDATAVAANASNTGSTSGNISTSTVGPSSAGGSGPYPKKKTSTEKDIVQSRLDLASALSHIGHRNYSKAAQSFLKIGAVKELGDWIGKVSVVSHFWTYPFVLSYFEVDHT